MVADLVVGIASHQTVAGINHPADPAGPQTEGDCAAIAVPVAAAHHVVAVG